MCGGKCNCEFSLGGGKAIVDLKSTQLKGQPHMPKLLKGRKEMHVENLVFARPTGVLWGIMYHVCHIVSVPHVFTPATLFKCPTCETTGPNQFL